VLARFPWVRTPSQAAQGILTESFAAVAEGSRAALDRRWERADVVIVDAPPVDAILAEARRYRATVIAVGWRGHGKFKRLLAGSVSRTVASRAECPVLIVREAPRSVRRFVVGFDGSPNSKGALDLLCSLEPGSTHRAVLVNIVEPVSIPSSMSRVPAFARGQIRRELAALKDERYRDAVRVVDAAASRLERCGWRVEREVRTGAPLDNLLRAADEARADVLVVGARGVAGIERALLGSVANGALDRARIPVLLVR
jgi:nucleotide-binding universal stress UspA family protein